VSASGLAWYLSSSLMMRTCPCCDAWCRGVSPNCQRETHRHTHTHTHTQL